MSSQTTFQIVDSMFRSSRARAAILVLLAWAHTPAQTNPPQTSAPRPQLTGYFPQWGLYNQPQYLVKNLVTAHGAAMLDQINYAQGFVTDGHCSVADPNADLTYTFSAQQSVDGIADSPNQPLRGNFNQLLKLKRQFPRLKIILSLEGRGSSFAADAQPAVRQAFVASCVDLFLRGNIAPGVQSPRLFDGIDIDWEYPGADDAANFLALLTEFRRQLDALRPGLRLDIAVGPSPRMYAASDFSTIAPLVDQVGIMTYDFTGPWSPITGFLAPFSAGPDRHYGTVKGSVESFLAAGVSASKLLVGLPFYGYGWHLVPEENNGLFQEGQAIRGDRPYSQIESIIGTSTLYRDPDSQAPWLFDGDVFWTYEDPTSIRFKSTYVRDHQLGGLMIWELGEDTPAATLLQAAYQALAIPLHPAAHPVQVTTSTNPAPWPPR